MPILHGRPIGLKAWMSKEQMKEHLIKIRTKWLSEGFGESEVTNAILSKCHPLLAGYYWARYPDASERLAQALQELGYPAGKKPQKQSKKTAAAGSGKSAVAGNLALQFDEFLKREGCLCVAKSLILSSFRKSAI